MPMAASEGQLALEFVRTLSEEAAAHRAYLQLLYTITLGAIGAGIALAATILWFVSRRTVADLKREISARYDAEIKQLVEIKNSEIQRSVSALNEKLFHIEREADQKIDDIVRFMNVKSKNELSNGVRTKNEGSKLSAIIFATDVGEPHSEMAFILLNLGFSIRYIDPFHEIATTDLLHDNIHEPVVIIDADEVPDGEAKSILNRVVADIPKKRILIYKSHLPVNVSDVSAYRVAVGPAALIDQLMEHIKGLEKG